MKFAKMQGIGNDYIYVNCFEESIEDPASLAVRLSDRHFGIGSDGLILIRPSENGDAMMDLYNADGSRAMMCGNGIRCVGKYIYEKGIAKKDVLKIDTLSGVKTLYLTIKNDRVSAVKVAMGTPVFLPEQIPVAGFEKPVIEYPYMLGGKTFPITCVSMGNPHCVIFVNNTEDFPVKEIGSALEKAPIFPESANIEFVHVRSEKELDMRVWERGSGETMACGTGACAALAAAVLTGRTERSAVVHLLGGDLFIDWPEEESDLFMSGPAEFVFEGTYPLFF